MIYVIEMINGHQTRNEETVTITHCKKHSIPYILFTIRQARRSNVFKEGEVYVPVGSIDFTHAVMKRFGIKIPTTRCYPLCFGRDDYQRNIPSITTLHDLDHHHLPVFIKPAEKLKHFPGFVLEDFDDYRLKDINPKHKLWHTEVVEFRKEIRCYVFDDGITFFGRHDKPMGMYDLMDMDSRKIVEWTGKLSAQGYHNYALDVGILKDGSMGIVEVNDGYSIGLYDNSEIANYLDILTARWFELLDKRDLDKQTLYVSPKSIVNVPWLTVLPETKS